MTSSQCPDITIVLCTFQRAEMLRTAIASLFDLNRAGLFSYEVLVVNNASTDHTDQVIEEVQAISEAPIRGVYEPRKGIVPARNRGVAEARGEWIAFFDDDQLADENWLLELYLFATMHNVKAVGGDVHLLFTSGVERDLAPTVRMLLGESRWSQSPRLYAGKVNPGCGNMMVHRSLFQEVGVFETSVHGRGEDTDLYRRIVARGHQFWYVPSAIVHHLTPPERLDPAYLGKLSYRMGEGVAWNEFRDRSRWMFVLRWLAKRARRELVHRPAQWLAMLTGNREMALERECQMQMGAGHYVKGLSLLLPSGRKVARTIDEGALAPVPGSSATATASLATAEPVQRSAASQPLVFAPEEVRGGQAATTTK